MLFPVHIERFKGFRRDLLLQMLQLISQHFPLSESWEGVCVCGGGLQKYPEVSACTRSDSVSRSAIHEGPVQPTVNSHYQHHLESEGSGRLPEEHK